MAKRRRPAVGIRQLKASLSAWVKRASKGETVDVTDRGRVVARLSGAKLPESDAESASGAALLLRLAMRSRPAWRRDGSTNVDRYLDEEIRGS